MLALLQIEIIPSLGDNATVLYGSIKCLDYNGLLGFAHLIMDRHPGGNRSTQPTDSSSNGTQPHAHDLADGLGSAELYKFYGQ